MRGLLDRGYVYIAQPPLYRVSRGKSEQYLKDERALEDYLIDTGLEETVLQLYSGEELARPGFAARSSMKREPFATCCADCTAATIGRWSSRPPFSVS